MGYVKRKRVEPKGTVRNLNGKAIWAGRVPQSNITRLMQEDEAKEWSKKTGRSVFTKLKKWELDQL